MFENILSVIVVIVLAALFGWLTRRSWSSRPPVAKWAGTFFAGLLTLVASLLAILAVVGMVYRSMLDHLLELQV